MTTRPAEIYGDIELSVQAGKYLYCTPRLDLPNLSDYSHVEVGFLYHRKLDRPSAAGIDGFDGLFEDGFGPVAPYVPLSDVERLREAIKARVEAIAAP